MRRTFLLYIVAGLSCAACADAATVTRGPYLQMGTPTSIIVKWRTDTLTDSRVAYGTTLSNLTMSVSDTTLTTEHEVSLTGLTVETKYFYAIGTTSTNLAGNDSSHFFVTAPYPGPANPTRIWIIGDCGTGNADAAAVRDAYYGYNGANYTDVWLMLGDNAYTTGTDLEYQAGVFNMYPFMLRQTAPWSTFGNHESYSGASSVSQTGPYYDIFTLPKNGEAGGLPSGTEAYYSFDHANIHFICLNSMDIDRSTNGAMMTWLQNDLAVTEQDWIIAYWHHPPYSKGSHNSDLEFELIEMRENALPILEAGGVDLVLSGHSHGYERSYYLHGHYGFSGSLDTNAMIIDGGDGRPGGDGAYLRQSTTGTVYVVAGSSGRISGGSLDHPVMFFSLLELGSLVLDVLSNRLDAAFINDSGIVRDTFTITKDLGSDTNSPVVTTVTATNDSTHLEITFSERVERSPGPGGAENITNYTVTGFSVADASLNVLGKKVTLTLAPQMIDNTNYSVTVSNINDQASPPNALDPAQTNLFTTSFYDTDGDSLPDWWETLFFGGPTNAAPDSDADGDGHSNLQEFDAGTVPTNDLSVLKFTDTEWLSGGSFVVRWTSSSNRSYILNKSTNLLEGFWALTNVAAVPPINSFTDSVAGSTLNFYRMKLDKD